MPHNVGWMGSEVQRVLSADNNEVYGPRDYLCRPVYVWSGDNGELSGTSPVSFNEVDIMLERLNALTILQTIAFFFFACLGWSAMATLWAWTDERGQRVAALIVVVVVLIAVALVYGGRGA